jgi:uncharacterized RDD family membrane protein YckC
VAKLIVNPTSANRREISLGRTSILTIGRDPSNDLVLPDAMVSRRHAVIEHRGSQFFLRDCNSANGSVVNGDRVSDRGLRDGDLVAIGSMRLLFREELGEAAGGKVVPHPSAAPLHCPSCGTEYRRGDLFCRECGGQVAQPSGPPKTVCPSCGAAVPLPARFCNACGASLAADGHRLEEPGPSEAAAPGPSRPAAPEGGLPPRDDTQPVARPPAAAEDAAGVHAAGSMAMAPAREAAARRRQAEPSRETPPAARSDRSVPSGGDRRAEPAREPAKPPEGARAPAAPAGPGVRILAGLFDTVFVLSGQAAILAPVAYYWWSRGTPQTPGEVSFLPILTSVVLVPLALLLGGLYHVYFWSARGATPGKELLDLQVEAEDGTSPIGLARAGLRAFGYLLSAASLGIGFLMVAFGGSGLHDRIAGTRVVRRRRP